MVSRVAQVESKIGPHEETPSGNLEKSGAYHVVGQLGIGLTTTTETTESVEHAGAQEAHKGDHTQLELGRGIPAHVVLADTDFLVHPSSWARDLLGERGADMRGRSHGFNLCHGEAMRRRVKPEGVSWGEAEVVEGDRPRSQAASAGSGWVLEKEEMDGCGCGEKERGKKVREAEEDGGIKKIAKHVEGEKLIASKIESGSSLEFGAVKHKPSVFVCSDCPHDGSNYGKLWGG